MSANLGVAAQLLQVRARGVVFDLGRLEGEPERLFPLRYGRIGKLRGKVGEGDRIARIGLPLIYVPKVPVARPAISREMLGYDFVTY